MSVFLDENKSNLDDENLRKFLQEIFLNVMPLILEYCREIDCPAKCGKKCLWYWGCSIDCGYLLEH
jgi:hypothetical protein